MYQMTQDKQSEATRKPKEESANKDKTSSTRTWLSAKLRREILATMNILMVIYFARNLKN